MQYDEFRHGWDVNDMAISGQTQHQIFIICTVVDEFMNATFPLRNISYSVTSVKER